MHTNWCALGLDAGRFWKITLVEYRRETKAAVEREYRLMKNQKWIAWHMAALSRSEKLPDLAEFMGVERQPQKPEDAEEMMRTIAVMFAKGPSL